MIHIARQSLAAASSRITTYETDVRDSYRYLSPREHGDSIDAARAARAELRRLAGRIDSIERSYRNLDGEARRAMRDNDKSPHDRIPVRPGLRFGQMNFLEGQLYLQDTLTDLIRQIDRVGRVVFEEYDDDNDEFDW
jgi:hypothetical protein